MSADAPIIEPSSASLKAYRKGMRNLGRSLVVLAVFQLVLGSMALLVVGNRVVPDALVLVSILGGMIGVNLFLGIMLLLNYPWVNYLVLGWGILLLVLSFVGIGMQNEAQKPGASTGSCLGLLIAAAMVYYASQNLSALRRVRAAGLSIEGDLGKVGYGLLFGVIAVGVFLIGGAAFFLLHRPSIDANVWKPIAPPGLGFQALMPGTPKEQQQAQEGPAGKVTLHKFTVTPLDGKELFMIVTLRFPEAAAEQIGGPEKLLNLGRMDILAAVGGIVQNERRIDLPGVPVLEIEVLPPKGASIKARIYATKNQVFQVTVHVPKVRVNSDDVQKFFNSFQLVGAPAEEGK